MKHLLLPEGVAHTYLLRLDPINRTLDVKKFSEDNLLQAQEEYIQAEKEAGNDPRVQIVLVSVDSLDALRSAYPNYYVDTEAFILAVNLAIL